jgi:succinate dehydrogenase / fumarate reductase, cytochrome b subunit
MPRRRGFLFVFPGFNLYNAARLAGVCLKRARVFARLSDSLRLINHVCHGLRVISTVKKNRPVNLDISTIKLPITAYVSILHRVSGVFLFAGVAVLLWMLDVSLSSQEGFDQIKAIGSSPVCQFILWVVLAGLAYHTSMGIRHLIMDFGVGESLKGGKIGATTALVVAIVLIVLAGVWVW